MLFQAKCHICKRIFCCGKCRQKHQIATHAIVVKQTLSQQLNVDADGRTDVNMNTTNIYVFCPICEKKPLALREGLYAELLEHIESVHLPLRCRKCLRHYTKIEDLREFTKCVDLGHNCSAASAEHNHTCDTDASKVTVKKVAATTISTQTSPCIAKDANAVQSHPGHHQQHQHLTPISLFNLRWKAKSRVTQEEFISDSVSSIRNLSSDSVNISGQQRLSIGAVATVGMEKGKVIRSTSTPLQIYTVFAKPKDTLTFNAGHVSSICHSGYVLDEQHTPVLDNNSNALQPPPPQQQTQPQQQQHQQRAWKVTGRGRMSAVTPLRQVMSKSIQKAFVEHGGKLAIQGETGQSPDGGSALDLRLSPAVRRTQSVESKEREEHIPEKHKMVLLSAQKHTTESIIITRAASTNASTTSTVYNSCESVEIITSSTSSSSATAELSANIQKGIVTGPLVIPPITPITRIPGAVINKKLIRFETPKKNETQETNVSDEGLQEDREIFYTPIQDESSSSTNAKQSSAERHRTQIVPRQLTGEFSPEKERTVPPPTLAAPRPRPQGPRARPPLRTCQNLKSFSGVQDVESDEEEVFLPNGASTHNDKKTESGRLWSIMSSVMRLPSTLRGSDRNASSVDKENTISPSDSNNSTSLIRRCASIAGSLVRTKHVHDDFAEGQPMKRKRTQTLDSQYSHTSNYHPTSPSSSSSKRLRIQPRKPVERMRNT